MQTTPIQPALHDSKCVVITPILRKQQRWQICPQKVHATAHPSISAILLPIQHMARPHALALSGCCCKRLLSPMRRSKLLVIVTFKTGSSSPWTRNFPKLFLPSPRMMHSPSAVDSNLNCKSNSFSCITCCSFLLQLLKPPMYLPVQGTLSLLGLVSSLSASCQENGLLTGSEVRRNHHTPSSRQQPLASKKALPCICTESSSTRCAGKGNGKDLARTAAVCGFAKDPAGWPLKSLVSWLAAAELAAVLAFNGVGKGTDTE